MEKETCPYSGISATNAMQTWSWQQPSWSPGRENREWNQNSRKQSPEREEKRNFPMPQNAELDIFKRMYTWLCLVKFQNFNGIQRILKVYRSINVLKIIVRLLQSSGWVAHICNDKVKGMTIGVNDRGGHGHWRRHGTEVQEYWKESEK